MDSFFLDAVWAEAHKAKPSEAAMTVIGKEMGGKAGIQDQWVGEVGGKAIDT